jgi:hypothetical protein
LAGTIVYLSGVAAAREPAADAHGQRTRRDEQRGVVEAHAADRD